MFTEIYTFKTHKQKLKIMSVIFISYETLFMLVYYETEKFIFYAVQ